MALIMQVFGWYPREKGLSSPLHVFHMMPAKLASFKQAWQVGDGHECYLPPSRAGLISTFPPKMVFVKPTVTKQPKYTLSLS